MDSNEMVIDKFYNAFARKDAAKMNACYSDDIVFYDPMFELLRGDEVRSMWEMLCGSAVELTLSHGEIKSLGDDYYTCAWNAQYKYSRSGRPVHNYITANMKIIDGVIIEHSDAFSLHKWSRQALGFSGWLLGWNSFFQRKIKNKARRSLLKYMKQL